MWKLYKSLKTVKLADSGRFSVNTNKTLIKQILLIHTIMNQYNETNFINIIQ